MTELLAPAGNQEKLRFAAHFGADAVYFGLKQFSLRNFAGNFSMDDAHTGLAYLHKLGKKGYVALNIYPFADEYKPLLKAAKSLDDMGVDGVIVSDIGVLSVLKKNGIRAPLHVSTQANTVSPQTIEVLSGLGASRINLARELSFEQVAQLQRAIRPLNVETEVFIHGSVCFSYSGRCAISDYLTGRRANRGECTHPCRWQYHLVEEKRPGQYMPVFEDERGLYFFNSKDLALFPYIQKLAALGVSSFKIEGRMKSIHYLASVLSFYRRVLDGEEISEDEGMKWLSRIKNRGYSYGFMKGTIEPEDYKLEKSSPTAFGMFLGNIIDSDGDNCAHLNVRNKIFAGEAVEILKTDGSLMQMTLPTPLIDTEGEALKHASHGTIIVLPFALPPFSILRRTSETEV